MHTIHTIRTIILARVTRYLTGTKKKKNAIVLAQRSLDHSIAGLWSQDLNSTKRKLWRP